jgi:hypothetical protein
MILFLGTNYHFILLFYDIKIHDDSSEWSNMKCKFNFDYINKNEIPTKILNNHCNKAEWIGLFLLNEITKSLNKKKLLLNNCEPQILMLYISNLLISIIIKFFHHDIFVYIIIFPIRNENYVLKISVKSHKCSHIA